MLASRLEETEMQRCALVCAQSNLRRAVTLLCGAACCGRDEMADRRRIAEERNSELLAVIRSTDASMKAVAARDRDMVARLGKWKQEVGRPSQDLPLKEHSQAVLLSLLAHKL